VWPTYEEAEAVANGAVELLAAGDRTRTPGVTLREYGNRWLDEAEVEGDHSIAHRRSRWQHVLSAPFVDMPLVAITRPVVVAWIKALGRSRVKRGRGPGAKLRPISRNHVSGIVGGLALILDAALDEGLIDTNPARGIRKRRKKGEQRKHDEDMAEVWTYLDIEEQTRVTTDPAIPEADRLIIAVAIGTGMRQGEQWNLELPDVHVDGPNPYIVVRWGSKGRRPKNGKIRTVPLFGLALGAFRRWLEILPTYAPKNPLRLAFPQPSGARRGPSKHLHRGTGGKVDGFRLALAAAGIERHVRWHDLRHTCASSLISGFWGRTWEAIEVRDFLGHQHVTVTERYAHLAPAALASKAALTPGLRLGYAPLAIVGESRSDRSSESGRCSSTENVTVPSTYAVGHPRITREAAIEGFRLLALGETDAARLVLARGWNETDLCRLFEAALAATDSEGRQAPAGGARGR
jgi:integrase